MLLFKPALWRDGVLFELPRPIGSLRIQDAWDYVRFKVPLVNGDFTAGHSRQGVDLQIEGRVATHAGNLKLSEAAMLATLEELRSRLHTVPGGELFQLFLYHDPASGTYRSFRQCCTVRFDWDLSDPRLFSYSAVIHASDPTIHLGPPV